MDDYSGKPASRADLAVVPARWLGEPASLEIAPITQDNTIERKIPLNPGLIKRAPERGSSQQPVGMNLQCLKDWMTTMIYCPR